MEVIVGDGSVWYIHDRAGPCLEYGYFTTREKAERFASDLSETARSRIIYSRQAYGYSRQAYGKDYYWANKLECSIHNDS